MQISSPGTLAPFLGPQYLIASSLQLNIRPLSHSGSDVCLVLYGVHGNRNAHFQIDFADRLPVQKLIRIHFNIINRVHVFLGLLVSWTCTNTASRCHTISLNDHFMI